ncbi:MAG TPA: DUF2007 domain-containing protein [Myxococcaceae bacterium]|nr:DUF2007 domain-containing protein [Myxococcaceae bacterium]
MIEVGRFPTRTEAELARSLLAEAGIPSVLAPEEATVDLSGGARLLVADGDAAAALVLLGPKPPQEDEDR